MKWLRYYLLTLSIVAGLALIVAAHDVRRPDAWEVTIFLFLLGSFTLNAFYLLAVSPTGEVRNFRIHRMFRLWLDAKEKDLERRARRDL